MNGHARIGLRRTFSGVVAALLIGTGLGVAVPLGVPPAAAATVTLTVVSSAVNETATPPGTCVGLPLGVEGVCTLQAAMQDAEALMSGGDDVIIEFAPALWGVTFQPGTAPGSANPALYRNSVPAGRTLTISGPASPAARPILDGNGENRIFHIGGAGNVVIRNVDMVDGETNALFPAGTLDGASVETTTVLTVENVSVTNGRAGVSNGGGAGGGISTTNDLTLINSTFDTMLGDGNGGAINVVGTDADLIVQGGSFSFGNNGGGGGLGGAIFCDCASVDIVGANFNDNIGRNGGGALYTTAPTVTVSSSTFTLNRAFVNDGGAIHASTGSNLTVLSSTFTANNAASNTGGAIFCDCASVDVSGSQFTSNIALVGAGIGTLTGGGADITISNSTFSTNSASVEGGGVWCSCNSLQVMETTFDINNAGLGGAGIWTDAPLLLRSSTFNASTAFEGAAVSVEQALADIEQTIFTNGTASDSGGAIKCFQCSGFDLRDSTFASNTSLGLGGALHLDASAIAVIDVTFSGNDATTDGGAIAVSPTLPVSPAVLLEEVTIADSGGAPGAGALFIADPNTTLAVEKSILADNQANCSFPVGFSFTGNNWANVIEGGGCAAVNSTVVTSDPGLLPLAPQGGPNRANGQPIPVHAITGLSVAENLNTCIQDTTDARGMVRRAGPCDAGAFELGLTVSVGAGPTAQYRSPASIVSLGDVPNAALTPPEGNGAADSQALSTVQVRGIDLATSPLRNIPLRNIGLAAVELSRDVLESISLAQIPLAYPGGWTAYLTDVGLTELASQPTNTVTLFQLLQATATLPEEDQLDLGQLDLSNTPLGTLSVGAVALGGAPLSDLAGSSAIDWCATFIEPYTDTPCNDTPGVEPGAIDTETATLVTLSLEGIPLRNIPLRNIPLRNIDLDSTPLRNIPLRNIPLRNIDLSVSPLRNIPLRNIPLRNIEIIDNAGNSYDIGTVVGAPLRNIPLRNIDLSVSPLRNIPLRNIELAASPLRNIPLRNIPLRNIDVDASPLRNIPLRNIDLSVSPLRNIPLRNIPLRNIPLRNIGGLEASPLRNIPLRNIALAGSPLRNIPLRNITTAAQLVNCLAVDCGPSGTLTLGQVSLLPTATLGVLADGLPDDTDLGILGDVVFGDNDTFVLADIADAFESLGLLDYTLAALLDVFTADLDGTYTLGDLAQALQTDPIGLESVFDLLFDAFTISDLLNILLADPAAYGIAAGAAAGVGEGIENLTIDDLIGLLAELEPPVTLADLFLGVFMPEDYPWDEIDLDAAADGLRSATDPAGIPFAVQVTSTLPTSLLDFIVTLPAGFSFVPGSLLLPSGATSVGQPAVTPRPDGSTRVVARISMPELAPNTPATIELRALPPLSVGTTEQLTAVVSAPEWSISSSTSDGYIINDALENNDTPAQASVLSRPADTLVVSHLSRPGDVDWFTFPVTQGQALSINLSNLPDDYDMLLFAPAPTTSLRGSAARVLVPAADNGLSLLGEDAVVAQIAPDVDTAAPPGYRLVEGSARRGTDVERIDTGPLSGGQYLLKITGYNGASAARPYVLRTRIDGLTIGQNCPAVTAPIGPALPLTGVVTAVTPGIDTLVLVDTARLQRAYPSGVASVISELATFTTTLANAPAAQFGGTRAAVLDVGDIPAVRAANAAWDAQPCDPERANGVVAAIGDVLDGVLALPGAVDVENLVLIGADEQIAMARLRDNTPAHNEQEYSSTWTQPNPVAAAQALGYVLSDDPYATSSPIAVGPRELFVPDLAVGRLVEKPADIVKALATFRTFDGELDPQTALSTGYDFLEDGARAVANEIKGDLVPAAGVNESLIDTGLDAWTKAELDSAFAESGPDVASVNAHFDHYRALPADQDAAGRLTDPLTVNDVSGAPDIGGVRPLEGSIIFSMGCHAGLSVSDIAVGTLSTDWAQTFGAQGSAVFAGNTGFGYGDTAVVAFSEELMRLFAERLSQAPSIGAAMTAAKQRYISDLAVLSPFEEKVSSQVVFYGLPMYRIAGAQAPTADPPETVVSDPMSGLPSSTVSLTPAATPATTPTGTYYHVGGEVQATPYQPVQPRTSTDVTADGRVARGALITSLVSNDVPGLIDPVVVTPTDDVTAANAEAPSTGAIFPSVLQSVARVTDLNGERDRLVVVPGQFRGVPGDPDGRGVQRLFTSVGARVFYAPIGNSDTTAPRIVSTSALIVDGQAVVEVEVGDPDVARVVVMYVESDAPNPRTWRSLELTTGNGLTWIGTAAVAAGAEQIDYFIQVLDTGGNVSVSSDKGSNFVAVTAPVVPPVASAPTLSVTPAAPSNGVFYTQSVTVSTVPGAPDQAVTLVVNGVPTPSPATLNATGIYEVQAVADGFDPVVRNLVLDLGARPTVTATVTPSAAPSGWYNVSTGLPTVAVTATPGSAPIASITIDGTPRTMTGNQASLLVNTQGERTLDFFATDTAGRSSVTGQVTVRVDTVAPTFTCPTAPTFFLNQPGTTITVPVSGATVGSMVLSAPTNVVGARTATASAADQAGNTVAVSCPYNVRYKVTGFFEPITMNVENVATAGRTIPVKWRITDFAGVGVSNAASFVRIAVSSTTCTATSSDDIETYLSINTSSLQYLGDGNWQYNWKTDKSMAGCRIMVVQLNDGSAISATFRFR